MALCVSISRPPLTSEASRGDVRRLCGAPSPQDGQYGPLTGGSRIITATVAIMFPALVIHHTPTVFVQKQNSMSTIIDTTGTELPCPEKPRVRPILAVSISRGRVEVISTPTRTSQLIRRRLLPPITTEARATALAKRTT